MLRILTAATALLAWSPRLEAAELAPALSSSSATLPNTGSSGATPPAPADQPPAPAPAPSTSEAQQPARSVVARVGINAYGGFFQPSALLQIWGVGDKFDGRRLDTTFRLRRVELRAKGEIVPDTVGYYVAFDVAKALSFTSSSSNVPVTGGTAGESVAVPSYTLAPDRAPLQDAYVTYLSAYADVSVGQFKIPVSLEGLQSSARLLFPERNRVTREYGDRRDLGVRIDKQVGSSFYYYVGLFNGQGQNVPDADRPKDAGLRVELYPILGLTLGGLAYGTVFGRGRAVRDRLEADLRIERDGFVAQAEFINAWTGPRSRRLEGRGAYGAFGYTVLDSVQPVFRAGVLDVNSGAVPAQTEAERGPLHFFEGGLNYLLKGNDAKLSASASYFNQSHSSSDVLEVILQCQAAF